MGTVVFPDALLKVFLTASVRVRAERRYKQLNDKGIRANLASLSRDLAERDERDANRAAAPLVPASDAVLLDSSDLSVEEVVAHVVRQAREKLESLKAC
jgi:cytidylate kinase